MFNVHVPKLCCVRVGRIRRLREHRNDAIRLAKVKNTQRNTHTLTIIIRITVYALSPLPPFHPHTMYSFFSTWTAKAESFIIYDADFGLRLHNNKYQQPQSHLLPCTVRADGRGQTSQTNSCGRSAARCDERKKNGRCFSSFSGEWCVREPPRTKPMHITALCRHSTNVYVDGRKRKSFHFFVGRRRHRRHRQRRQCLRLLLPLI